MSSNNDFHARTLSYVADELHIRGSWPSPLQISRSWARAEARAWNDDTSIAFVRLVRGGAGFLRDTSDQLLDFGPGAVLSPVLLEGQKRVWVRAGYEPAHELGVMERSVTTPFAEPGFSVRQSVVVDQKILRVDRAAFEPFWRMSADGLREGLRSTKTASILSIDEDTQTVAYAMIGVQWGTAYLQRIAVDPANSGKGHGTALIHAALAWARTAGASTMVLNVKPANENAISLYTKLGFATTPSPAHVYRYAA